MHDGLRLTFEADTDGTGELFARVQSNGFSGASSAWFGVEELVAFAAGLAAAYPLLTDKPLRLEGGFWSRIDSTIEQLHVGLQFYPIGSVGSVGCGVTLATQVHEHERLQGQASVAVELQTTYENVRTFARSLEMLAKGTTDEAILEARG
jgi:hypothetical protein